MGKDALNSAMSSNVVSGNDAPGGSFYRYNIEDKPSPQLDSAEASLGFPTIDMGPLGEAIPTLMTVFQPSEDGKGTMDSSYGTEPISGGK